MLNGWDVLAILIAGVLVYEIIKVTVMGITANSAVKKAKNLGIGEEEIYKQVDKIVDNALKETIKLLDEKQKEFEERLTKDEDEIKKLKKEATVTMNVDLGETKETPKEEVKKTRAKRSVATNRTTTRKTTRTKKED